MSTAIYYFSATGNSMTTARKLAEKLGDCRLIPAASTKSLSKIKEEADVVGFVFPVYYGDMPYVVREMICKMTFNSEAYVFLCATYRGFAGTVATKLDQLLRSRSQKLSLSRGLPMPGNSFINPPEVDADHLKNQDANIEKVLADITARVTEDYATAEVISIRPVDFPNNFRGIMSDENCIGCGICASVCPMNNIKIVDGKSVIGDDCATCLACFHWCPNEAIYMSEEKDIGRRSKYRHPDVSLKDIIAQKKPV